MNHRLTDQEKEDRKRKDEIYAAARAEKLLEVEKWELNQFFRAHINDGICFIANIHILVEALKEFGLELTRGNLEFVFKEPQVRSRLTFEKGERQYQRVTNTQHSRVMPQLPKDVVGSTPRPVVLQMTAEEIKALPAATLQRLMRDPEALKELNRILNVKI